MVHGPLIVICGPTATGKSDQALQLALQLRSPLIHADSRQIYREFDIGTAKPTQADRALWPHELVDCVDPTDTFTVAQYQAQAQALIDQAHHHEHVPILVGGTGLYIQAVTAGLGIPSVPPQPQLRDQLMTQDQSLRYQFLCQIDPVATQKIHANDGIRTLRALEIYYTTGRAPSQLQTHHPPPYTILVLGLTCAKDRLQRRIAQRTTRMFAQGWIEEVQQLRLKYGSTLPLLNTLGYAEIGRYLDGDLPWLEVEPLIVQHTRQFAKRQLTWFRRTPGIEWFECDDPDLGDQIRARVEAFWEGS